MNYNTAQDAFNSLKIGTIFNKNICNLSIKKVAEACDVSPTPPQWSGHEFDYHCRLFYTETKLRFAYKKINIGTTTQGQVVIFSDCRQGDWNDNVIKNLLNLTTVNNINIESFIKPYSEISCADGWEPQNTKYYSGGYNRFYRGNLVGIIITYHPPTKAETRILQLEKKRKKKRDTERRRIAKEEEKQREKQFQLTIRENARRCWNQFKLLKKNKNQKSKKNNKEIPNAVGTLSSSSYGTIYLLQPAEFVGTKIYKIGMSRKNTLTRVKNYGRTTEHIIIQRHDDPCGIEKEMIKKFKEKFKLYKGREYFQGDDEDMQATFLEVIAAYKVEVVPTILTTRTTAPNQFNRVMPSDLSHRQRTELKEMVMERMRSAAVLRDDAFNSCL